VKHSSQSRNLDWLLQSKNRALLIVALAFVLPLLFWLGNTLLQLGAVFSAETVNDGAVTVRRQQPTLTKKYLQGADWQRLSAQCSAYTHWSYMCRADFDLKVTPVPGKRNLFSVACAGARVDLSLPITMWLPFGVASPLMEHEDGHRQLCELVYSTAAPVAVRCAKDLIAQPLSISAGSASAAQGVARQKVNANLATAYRRETEDIARPLSELLDKITVHGTNGMKTQDGLDQAIQQFVKTHPDYAQRLLRKN
jgi:hypothetical protein